jgi:hypothetical protein
MPRWLLAVFVLQLLWNMAGFPAMGQPHERAEASEQTSTLASAPASGQALVAAWADPSVQAARGPGAAANGLLDELPDLPDTLLRRAAPRTPAGPTPSHTGWVHNGSPDALLRALFRPPPARA